jgi:hypothetical protein
LKIIDVLNEGVIKVPNETYLDAMNVVSSDVFSRVFNYIETREVQASQPELENIYKEKYREYSKKYNGRFTVLRDFSPEKETVGSVHIRMADVDPRYFNKNPNAKKQTYTIVISVRVEEGANYQGAEYHQKEAGRAAKVVLLLADQKRLEQIFKNPDLFDSMMHAIEGSVEHELMHAIQDMAFKMTDKDADYYDDKGKIIDDKYYSSEIEFSPQIVSTAKDYTSGIAELKALGYDVPPTVAKALMLKYVNPSAPKVPGIAANTNPFFATLYNKDKAKWKRAIKYFYGLISKQ